MTRGGKRSRADTRRKREYFEEEGEEERTEREAHYEVLRQIPDPEEERRMGTEAQFGPESASGRERQYGRPPEQLRDISEFRSAFRVVGIRHRLAESEHLSPFCTVRVVGQMSVFCEGEILYAIPCHFDDKVQRGVRTERPFSPPPLPRAPRVPPPEGSRPSPPPNNNAQR
jgi:hypothetical protein